MRARLIHGRAVELDVEELRRRLAAPGPGAEALPGDPGVEGDGAGLTRAAVLMPIVVREQELTMLFTRRTANLRSHSGQISFPGGRAEPADPTPESTALRETQEEIGLPPDRVRLLGRLDDYSTRTGYRIAPVVGAVQAPFELRPDPDEVDEVFEVPLSFLLDPRNHQQHSRVFQGETRWFYAVPYRDYYIWGATAGMLVNLYRHLCYLETSPRPSVS
ncbi:MAG TPA: CoA pyrophosphatase [Burkholderiales bacterium]|nr:CoA pyrophosphatase [Burkholderiales bacterium]